MLGSNKVLGPKKNLGPKRFWIQFFFWTLNLIWTKHLLFLWTQNLFWTQKFVLTQMSFGGQHIFWIKFFFRSQINPIQYFYICCLLFTMIKLRGLLPLFKVHLCLPLRFWQKKYNSITNPLINHFLQ